MPKINSKYFEVVCCPLPTPYGVFRKGSTKNINCNTYHQKYFMLTHRKNEENFIFL